MVVFPMKPRLLVIELHHLGDAVMSLPFVRGAQKNYDVHVLCRPAVAPIYRLLANAPQIHEWEPPWADDRSCGALSAIRSASAIGRSMANRAFESAVCVWADARVEIIMAASRAKQRVGFPMTRGNYYAANLAWRAKRLISGQVLEKVYSLAGPVSPLLTTWLHRESARQHHSRCWEQIAQSVDADCDYSVPWIVAEPLREVWNPRTEAATAGKMLLALHGQARLLSKQWPLAKWRALCSLPSIREKYHLLEIVPPGSKAEIEGVPSIVTADVKSLASVLDAADALVCHDSLPAHLAAALGKPVVTIFGSGEPDWFAPWHNRDLAVQRHVCPLHPCIDRCGMDSFLCLEAVSVDDVAGKVLKAAARK